MYIYIYICICMYIYIYTYICICIYINIYPLCNKIMLKIQNLIKNTPPSLHHIKQLRGLLKTQSNI